MNRLFLYIRTKHRIGWPDLLVTIIIVGALYAILDMGRSMVVPLSSTNQPVIHLNPIYLPYYAGQSLMRMFIAYALSLAFSLVYGRIAAYHKFAERIMIPALDILQSVPVLGFLSITVTGFLALFPGNLFGAECACIFAIFTSQAWNMTFSFYHSLTIMPNDLKEAADIYRLRPWARFIKLEVPSSMIGLVWNSMMSFGGAWFFLAASESITVLHKNIQLPGIGSYMSKAYLKGDVQAMLYSIATMIIVIVAVDQFVWRPIVAWSQKYKLDVNDSENEPTSWFLQLLRRSEWVQAVLAAIFRPLASLPTKIGRTMARLSIPRRKRMVRLPKQTSWIFLALVVLFGARFTVGAVHQVVQLGWTQILNAFQVGFYTFLRVIAATALGALWAIPVGVVIGLNSRLSRIAQPVVQVAASFPANMVFPFVTMFYVAWHFNLNIGSVLLMMLGTQWYILFNVIAGAMAIPSGLREASSILHLSSLTRWKTLILPAIFPNLITGMITASGGAWNASIVAEATRWKSHTLSASGLGAYIVHATTDGNWAQITLGIAVMSIFVVIVNRILWRPLYRLAETKYRLD